MTTPAGDGLGERLKDAFRRYPTGVAVISAAGRQGPVGLTASSVASVSVRPPALSFSLLSTPSGKEILDAPSMVVHLLGSRHAGLARDFARSDGPRFTPEQGWVDLPTGEPWLPDVPYALRVEPLRLVPVGDATLVVAAVAEVLTGPGDGWLVHYSRTFLTPEG